MKIDHLPDDSLYEILGHLNTKRDIENVLIVSKKWYVTQIHSLDLVFGIAVVGSIIFQFFLPRSDQEKYLCH